MRAISRFASLRRAGFSSAPVADWKRKLKSSWRRSESARSSSSSVMSRNCLARKQISLSLHEFRPDRELGAGKAQRLLGERLGNSGELEHHTARLDDADPVLGRALARAHARLGRLLRHRLVRKHVDPDLAATLDLACHCDSGSLDLTVGDPAVLERLDPVVAVLHRRLALGEPTTAAALDLPELGFLGQEHQLSDFSALSSPDWSSFVGSSCCFLVVVDSVASATASGVVGASGWTSGSSRPSAVVPWSSVRGFSTLSCAAPRPCPPAGASPRRPRRGLRSRTGPRPSRSPLPPRRPASREADSPSVLPPLRRAVSWSPSRASRRPSTDS